MIKRMGNVISWIIGYFMGASTVIIWALGAANKKHDEDEYGGSKLNDN